MKKAISALALSAVSVAFGVALAGAGGTPAAAQTNVGDAVGDLRQVQQESPEPGRSDGARDHNCPDRDGDGELDAPQNGATSAEQA